MVKTPRRGAVWWADLGEPAGSEPGYRRPVLIVQEDHFNASDLATTLVVAITSKLRYRRLPGNVLLPKSESGLAKDSVANVTQLTTIDKAWLDEYVADLPASTMQRVDRGLALVLGL